MANDLTPDEKLSCAKHNAKQLIREYRDRLIIVQMLIAFVLVYYIEVDRLLLFFDRHLGGRENLLYNDFGKAAVFIVFLISSFVVARVFTALIFIGLRDSID